MHFDTTRGIGSSKLRENRFLTDGLNSWYARKLGLCGCSFDDDALFSGEIERPVDSTEGIKKGIKISDFGFSQREVDPIGKATPEQEIIHLFFRSLAFDETILSTYIIQVEFFALTFHERFESRLASKNKLKGKLHHRRSVYKKNKIANILTIKLIYL